MEPIFLSDSLKLKSTPFFDDPALYFFPTVFYIFVELPRKWVLVLGERNDSEDTQTCGVPAHQRNRARQLLCRKTILPQGYGVDLPFPVPITIQKAPSSHVSDPALCRTRSNGASPPRSSAPPLAKPGQSPDFSRTGKTAFRRVTEFLVKSRSHTPRRQHHHHHEHQGNRQMHRHYLRLSGKNGRAVIR